VETPDPFLGLFCAMFRPPSSFPLEKARGYYIDRTPNHVNPIQNGPSKLTEEIKNLKPWHATESLSIHQALDMYTTTAAYACMRERDLGKLNVGYLADFVILNHDIIKDNKVETLLGAKAEEVWVNGQKVNTSHLDTHSHQEQPDDVSIDSACQISSKL